MVPLIIAFMPLTSLATRSRISGDTTGVPPATLASNSTRTSLSLAISNISGPCFAMTSLLAVTTCLPAFNAANMNSRAGCSPPITSTTISTSSLSIISSKLSVNRLGETSNERDLDLSLTKINLRSTFAPI